MHRNSHSKDFNLKSPTKNTEILLNEIKEATNIYRYLEKNSGQFFRPSFSSYLLQLLGEKNIKKTKLMYLTGLSRSFLYSILKDEKTPSRETVIHVIFAVRASLEEAYNLLQYAGHQPLYAKDIRDSILIFGLQQKMSLTEVNDILFDINIEPIL